jgi:NAD(P)-dependent dehydrogenase (short-subunit alcohol dehydrogenase family)
MKLAGKTAVITGASQGLGFEISRAFLREGANVLICARTDADLQSARERLEIEAPGRVLAEPADVSSEADMKRVFERFSRTHDILNILVCNAGVYGPKGMIDAVDWDAWRRAIDINLLGPVLCCRTFLPLLERARRSKIIILSGGGATKPLPGLSAYATSKAAVVRFGETLAEELRSRSIDVNLVAPGALNTRLLDEVLESGPERVGQAFYEACLRQKQSGGTPLAQGANLCVYLGSDASDGITGKLISAVWDPWETLGERRDRLQATDIYTLRRIVPEDRGEKWE